MQQTKKEFYEQNAEAAMLRNVCLDALEAADIIRKSGGHDPEAIKNLIDANAELDLYGITPDMHTLDSEDPNYDRKYEELTTDPLLTAQWLAGQVRLRGQDLPLDYLDRADTLLSHRDASGSHEAMPFNTNNLNRRNRKLALGAAMLGGIAAQLDPELGPIDLNAASADVEPVSQTPTQQNASSFRSHISGLIDTK